MSGTIRRRSLPDSLRYLADRLDSETVTDAERAGVAVTLHALADEISPPFEPCATPALIGTERCALPVGHDGRHKQGNTSWPSSST